MTIDADCTAVNNLVVYSTRKASMGISADICTLKIRTMYCVGKLEVLIRGSYWIFQIPFSES
jgi:hypothetical protein